jgi:hypothetical protein
VAWRQWLGQRRTIARSERKSGILVLIDYTRLAGRRWTSSVGGIPIANVLDEVLAANQTYATEFGERGRLPLPPARRFAICMDARLDPAKLAGEGDQVE